MLRWSSMVTSSRKDVEGTFGILKGRFRILKVLIAAVLMRCACLVRVLKQHVTFCSQIPCQYQDEVKVDNVFLTCCILHNMLLDWSCRDIAMIEEGNWLAEGGLHDEDDQQLRAVIARAHKDRGLGAPDAGANYDASFVGWPVMDKEVEIDKGNDGTIGFAELRNRLIANFSWRYLQKKDIVWLG